jgi:hypothetical protein
MLLSSKYIAIVCRWLQFKTISKESKAIVRSYTEIGRSNKIGAAGGRRLNKEE